MKTLENIFIMVDSCAFWAPIKSEQDAMKKLLELETKDIIINGLDLAEPTEEEQERAGTPSVIRKQTSGRIIAVPSCDTSEDRQVWQDIRNTLFKDKAELTRSDLTDINNIYTAWYYPEYTYFITYDKKHILSKAQLIRERFRIQCVTPKECLTLVEKVLQEMATLKL